ncbi:MAG: hypothetical protein RR891_11375 [Clostridium sp.]
MDILFRRKILSADKIKLLIYIRYIKKLIVAKMLKKFDEYDISRERAV